MLGGLQHGYSDFSGRGYLARSLARGVQRLAVGAQSGAVDAGINEGGAYQQHADAVVFQLGAQAVKKTVQGVFTGGVAGAVNQRCKTRNTGNRHHHPARLPLQGEDEGVA